MFKQKCNFALLYDAIPSEIIAFFKELPLVGFVLSGVAKYKIALRLSELALIVTIPSPVEL